MQVKQFEDKNLSHYSYAILSDCERKIALIDPARNAEPYLAFAREHKAQIIAVIETHPHADFISSHLEIEQATGATIYSSKQAGAYYPHVSFDEGDKIEFGKIILTPINTPGHSPDSISILLEHNGTQKAIFTGDTLFVGDCGRPDLREVEGQIQSTRLELAKQMYHSLRDKLMRLEDDVLVYPAHGAGTLCGKNLSKESRSTIVKEKETNWSLQEATEDEFVKNLLADQPFVPLYFPFDVDLNRKGAAPMQQNIARIKISESVDHFQGAVIDKSLWIIDARKEEDFKNGHLPNSINLMEDGKFETWLGSMIKPGEKFYLAGESKDQLQRMMVRAAAIGYETSIVEAFVITTGKIQEAEIDLDIFRKHPDAYTIVDVRNALEVKESKRFRGSLSIPLPEVRERIAEIPTDKPIVVHCAGGYRSAAASSLIHARLNGTVSVFDLGESIKEFIK